MTLPLPNPQSLGEIILERMGQGKRNALLNEELRSKSMENSFAPEKQKMQKQQSERLNQLFPEELKKAQLANQLSQMNVDIFKPQKESEMNYRNAQTNKLNFQNENPLYGQPGVTGQLAAAELLKRNPQLASNPNALNMIMSSISQGQESKQAQTELQKKQAAGYDFNNLPIGTKEYILAQAAGMGIYPDEARKMLTSGKKSLSDIAKEKGFDPNDLPEPIYPLTRSGQTQLKSRKAALAELESLGKTITKWSGDYSQQIMGISPKLFKEAITGKNKEWQSQFYAAQMLAPEQAAIRIKALGGNVGIAAMEEMTHRAMLNGKNLQALVTPDVYKRANELVEKAIYDSVEAANKASTKAVSSSNKETEKEEKTEMTYNPATGRLE